MNPASSISPILGPLFDILDSIGHNGIVLSDDKYADLLGQTVRAMKERLSVLQDKKGILLDQVDKLDEEITTAQRDLEAFTAIWNRTPFRGLEMGNTKPLSSEKSFTAAIEYVLKALSRKMSPTEIRDKMGEWGFDLSVYESNVVASIHTTLKRLAANGRVICHHEGPRRTLWEWAKEPDTNNGSLEPNTRTA